MSKIISLQAENVKRLKAVSIVPKGNVVVIGGKNAQGKTSVLHAIAMAIGGTKEIPDKPVRTGQAKAKIILETEELVVRRTFTKDGGGTLVVENKEGLRYSSPQEVLNRLTAKLTFDPLAFLSVTPEKQAAALQSLVGLNFAPLRQRIKGIYDERTLVNRDVAQTRLYAENLPHYPEAPKEPVSTADLVKELDKAKAHNSQKFGLETKHEEANEALQAAEEAATNARLKIADLEAKLAQARTALQQCEVAVKGAKEAEDTAKAAVTSFQVVDESPITTRLSASATTNAQVQANATRQEALASLATKTAHADGLTAQIAGIEKEMADQLAAAKFPIPGLSFTEEAVLFNGISLSEASDAEKIRVSVAISAAMNPKLRIMLARQGSLLDEDNLALLADLAKEYDVQVWLEVVSTDKKKCQVIITDGMVQGEESEPAAAAPDADAAKEPAFSV